MSHPWSGNQALRRFHEQTSAGLPGSRWVGQALAVACTLFGVASSHATTVRHLDTRELTRGSSEIVIAEVVGTRPHWNETHTKIVTDVELKVTRALKGRMAQATAESRSAEERLTLTQLGGEVDGVRYNVPGCPVFRAGEETLLFVWRDAKGRAQVNGLAQGKFDIVKDPATGDRLVERPLPGFGVRDVKRLAPFGRGERAPRLRLADLIGEIQRALEAEGGR